MPTTPYTSIPTFDKETGDLLVIIDTPKGSRNKFEFSQEYGLFKLGGVLPQGAVFPYDFGFVPQTKGGDGDPLDVLLLMDDPAFTGCLVPARLIGVIEAEQVEGGKTQRNDRLIAVASNSRNHADIADLDALPGNTVDEIEHFFTSYNEAKGKQFTILGRHGPDHARSLLEQSMAEGEGE